MERPTDFMDAMRRYEDGELPEDELFRLFQYLIDTGLVTQLQGHYARVARRLIDVGLCVPRQASAQ